MGLLTGGDIVGSLASAAGFADLGGEGLGALMLQVSAGEVSIAWLDHLAQQEINASACGSAQRSFWQSIYQMSNWANFVAWPSGFSK